MGRQLRDPSAGCAHRLIEWLPPP